VWLRDGATWSEIRLRDERHLAPWEPTPPGGWVAGHAAAEWPGRWWTLRAAARRGSVLPFALVVDGVLAGHVMIGNVVREPLLSAYVGYWCDTRLTGRGVTTAGVALAVDHCFGPVGLHRLERRCGRRTRRACGCWPSSASARRGCSADTSTSTGPGGTISASR
jgi:ribosomal-protein-alanine N-acetyltransferase